MWQSLPIVAKNRCLNARKLIAFADQPANMDRFGLCISGKDLLVNTWHVDGLINAFKETLSTENLEADRQQANRDSQQTAC